MSLLTETLERILKWKQEHFPSQISLLQPGLTDAEIDQITRSWSIQIPIELRELYKWRNGSFPDDIGQYCWIFDGFTYLPLQNLTLEYQPGTEEDRWKNPNIFLPNSLKIFITPEADQGYVVVTKKGEIDWIEFGYWSDGFWICDIYYNSLTNMMLTLAEYIEKNDYIGSIWYTSKDNRNKCIQIWCQYNSYQVDESKVEDLLRQPSWESISLIVTESIRFRKPKTWETLAHLVQKIGINTKNSEIRHLAAKLIYLEDDYQKIKLNNKNLENEYWQTRPTSKLSLYQKGLIEVDYNEIDYFMNALESNDARIKRTVAFLLFMLNAVEPLIKALTSNDVGIRRESVWALGQIGDSRAAKPIIEALRDTNAEVREAAREAWEKLILKSPEIGDIIPF